MFKTIMTPRKKKCGRCGRTDTEEFYGKGFEGWQSIMWIQDDITREYMMLCPDCIKKINDWIFNKKELM